jgi:hypothetical protein
MVGCTKLAHGPDTVWSPSAGQHALVARPEQGKSGFEKDVWSDREIRKVVSHTLWFVKHTPWNADVRHSAGVEEG